MGLWDELRSRLLGDEPEERPEEDLAPSAAVAARQERAAGRILDDEGLRGDLTDDEYQPLLDWALGVTDQVAARTAELDEDQADTAIDGGIDVVRVVLRAAADAIVAHNEGRAEGRRWALDEVSQAWNPSIIGGDDSDLPATLWQPLQQLADRLDAEPERSGAEVAGAIVDALTPTSAGDDSRQGESSCAAEASERAEDAL